jgi:succinylglutamate desuccinylase
MLKILEKLPEGFLDATPAALEELLGGPALIHLPGRRQPALFVSMMLHGNEPVGLHAIQALLKNYRERELPRALSFFVGNVFAARQGQRRLDGQPDYNRIWGVKGNQPEHHMVDRVAEQMRLRGVFASIDIHNNTGINPHYACINRLDHPFLQLASLFGRTVVYFTRPAGVQSMAFAGLCPAVTLECGQPEQEQGAEHARAFIEDCLNLHEIPAHPVAPHDISVFHTVAIVKVPRHVSFAFGLRDVQLQFIDDIDHFNFSEIPAGTCFGWQHDESATLECRDEHGNDVSERYFHYHDGKIELTTDVMPSMLTRNEKVIRQDCFCYLMERLELPTG